LLLVDLETAVSLLRGVNPKLRIAPSFYAIRRVKYCARLVLALISATPQLSLIGDAEMKFDYGSWALEIASLSEPVFLKVYLLEEPRDLKAYVTAQVRVLDEAAEIARKLGYEKAANVLSDLADIGFYMVLDVDEVEGRDLGEILREAVVVKLCEAIESDEPCGEDLRREFEKISSRAFTSRDIELVKTFLEIGKIILKTVRRQ